MNPNYLDLRFIIGLFFLLIGLIVFATSFGSSSVANGNTINHFTSLALLVFAAVMLLSFLLGKK